MPAMFNADNLLKRFHLILSIGDRNNARGTKRAIRIVIVAYIKEQ